jgi:protein involved in polysaccharide export with SLBB domain
MRFRKEGAFSLKGARVSLCARFHLICILLLAGCLAGPCVRVARAQERGTMRDFPPLEDPNRPRTTAPPETVRTAPPPAQVPVPAAEATPASYALGVGDELTVSVLGEPEMTHAVTVRPDGLITVPGAGSVFALSRSPEDVGKEIESKLMRLLRHPVVDLLVDKYGDRKVFVMGEVVAAGEVNCYKGISALQAIAQAGGFRSTAKRGSVVVLRRTGESEARFFKLDLGAALSGGQGHDMMLEPYDIVYVPRTFIANADVFIDQVIRPAITPFSLYLEGWNAFNIGSKGVRVYSVP